MNCSRCKEGDPNCNVCHSKPEESEEVQKADAARYRRLEQEARDKKEFLDTATSIESIELMGWASITTFYTDREWRSLRQELEEQKAHGETVKLVRDLVGRYTIYEHKHDRWPISLD